jgi:methylphosphotriester-DNA--protein-cysteine methyltransferase
MIAPQADTAELINTYYIIETEAGRIAEPIPAYSAQLLVVVRGKLLITYADGSTAQTSTVTLNSPQLRSADCVLEGPVMIVGASLTQLGWQTLANLPADKVHDQLIPPQAVIPADMIARLETAAAACRAGQLAPRDLCPLLAAPVTARPFAPRADHVTVAHAISRWLASSLDPDLSELYAAVDVSARQLQRICRRFFGVPPAQVLKRWRAMRTAILLAQPGLDETLRNQLLATYSDQAHMINDVRRYTGRTPTQLRRYSLASEVLQPAAHGDAGVALRNLDD